MHLKVVDLVRKDNHCSFHSYRNGTMFYEVESVTGVKYLFPIPLDDLGNASLAAKEKSVFLMRYIRTAMAENTLVGAGIL